MKVEIKKEIVQPYAMIDNQLFFRSRENAEFFAIHKLKLDNKKFIIKKSMQTLDTWHLWIQKEEWTKNILPRIKEVISNHGKRY